MGSGEKEGGRDGVDMEKATRHSLSRNCHLFSTMPFRRSCGTKENVDHSCLPEVGYAPLTYMHVCVCVLRHSKLGVT